MSETPQEVLRKLLPLSSEKKYADAFAAAIDALDERERLRAECEHLRQQHEAAVRSTAQQLEHEDTAPHEGCACKLCVALAEVNQLRGYYDDILAENQMLRQRVDLQTIEKRTTRIEDLHKRIAELEPFQPVKWALVSGKPSYDDLADQHAKAVQLVGEQQKKIEALTENAQLRNEKKLAFDENRKLRTELERITQDRSRVAEQGFNAAIEQGKSLQRIAELEAIVQSARRKLFNLRAKLDAAQFEETVNITEMILAGTRPPVLDPIQETES